MNAGLDPIPGFVKEYIYVRPSESSYSIVTDAKTRTIFNRITSYLNCNVHLFIVPLMKPSAGDGLVDAMAWLEKHLTED